MEVSNATKKENTLEALAFKSCATQYYVQVCENREGRKTPPKCDVHHINGNHNDNRPENLIIVPDDMHRWLHKGAKKANPWMAEINWFDFKKNFFQHPNPQEEHTPLQHASQHHA